MSQLNTNQTNIVVTGAYGGIGRALCRVLVEQGAHLQLVGRNQGRLDQLQSELHNLSRPTQEIKSYCVDLREDQQIEALSVQLQQLQHQPNILINNAGIGHFGMFADSSAEILSDLMQVNVLAQMRLTQLLLPMFMTQPKARVVNVGSVFGSIGYPGFSAYASSKFALRGFSESLARELSDSNISIGYFTARATDTSLNSANVVALNKELKTPVDSPQLVALKLSKFVHSTSMTSSVGWPEKLFLKLNSLLPSLVTDSISKQLPVIKRFATA